MKHLDLKGWEVYLGEYMSFMGLPRNLSKIEPSDNKRFPYEILVYAKELDRYVFSCYVDGNGRTNSINIGGTDAETLLGMELLNRFVGGGFDGYSHCGDFLSLVSILGKGT